MTTLLLLLNLVLAPMAKPGTCETVGPRLDGTYVTICGGRVAAVSDGRGNVHRRPF